MPLRLPPLPSCIVRVRAALLWRAAYRSDDEQERSPGSRVTAGAPVAYASTGSSTGSLRSVQTMRPETLS